MHAVQLEGETQDKVAEEAVAQEFEGVVQFFKKALGDKVEKVAVSNRWGNNMQWNCQWMLNVIHCTPSRALIVSSTYMSQVFVSCRVQRLHTAVNLPAVPHMPATH